VLIIFTDGVTKNKVAINPNQVLAVIMSKEENSDKTVTAIMMTGGTAMVDESFDVVVEMLRENNS
jgi:hypothetical protein